MQRQLVATRPIHGDESYRNPHEAVPICNQKGGPNEAYNFYEHMALAGGSLRLEPAPQQVLENPQVLHTTPQNSMKGPT